MTSSPSIFDLFSIGIGPSSSHTVGPMRAAAQFRRRLENSPQLDRIAGLRATCYGSLAATGKGHGTDTAILLGLLGEDPETVDPDAIPRLIRDLKDAGVLDLAPGRRIEFLAERDVDLTHTRPLPLHPNGMHFVAIDASGEPLVEDVVYSTGGGFIAREEELLRPPTDDRAALPLPFETADELLAVCDREKLSIAEVVFQNELASANAETVRARLARIRQVMKQSIRNGIRRTGELPGPLHVLRRARRLRRKLMLNGEKQLRDPLAILDWVNLYAIAVSEENAAGGRIVTAPTNGASGIIPAVLNYAEQFCASPYDDALDRFLLTAGGIGLLYKKNASISGADVGCQGEVGVACSMAAGALTELVGGTPRQVENAAEIAMEHNLGLTCDPIGGLVQIPCIERNAIAAVKALNASRLALCGSGQSFVTLDQVMRTMLSTGRDMQSKYKETAMGGLAVNVVNC